MFSHFGFPQQSGFPSLCTHMAVSSWNTLILLINFVILVYNLRLLVPFFFLLTKENNISLELVTCMVLFQRSMA